MRGRSAEWMLRTVHTHDQQPGETGPDSPECMADGMSPCAPDREEFGRGREAECEPDEHSAAGGGSE